MARSLVALAGAALLASCTPQPVAKPGTVTLTYATPYPPAHPFSRADIAWMDWVATESGGRIAFKPYWAGALLSSDMSMIEVRHGLADIGLITPIYARGGAHMLRAQSGFYGGIKTIGDQVAVYDCLAAKFPEFGAELKGLHVLAVQGGNFPGVLTRDKEVRSLADLKGLRLRAPGENIDVLRALGADPVNMPMGEVYSALAKGVIDGVVAPADTIKSLHFAEVARHFTTMHFARGAYPARAMSDAAWNRLTPDLQALLLRGKPVWEAALAEQVTKAEHDGIAYAAGHGVAIGPLPAADQARFDQLYNRFALEQATRLKSVGLDGRPVFAEAQRLIAAGPISCPTPAPGATS